MVYTVIGLMSGSSLDGVDIACVQFTEVRGSWSYELLAAECIAYEDAWKLSLQKATALPVRDFLKLHTAYGHFLGKEVNAFIAKHGLEHKIHFIASHGHTVLHEPAAYTTIQIGDGAAISAITSLPVITDLRAVDVALGGQGAPIVPIGDKLLFGAYDYLLNLGGIANITIKEDNDRYIAFDICACNQVLNALAMEAGKEYDEDGLVAACGKLLPELLAQLDAIAWYDKPAPKSLANDFSVNEVLPLIQKYDAILADKMYTAAAHIAGSIKLAMAPYLKPFSSMLITGGGAFNKHLAAAITEELKPYSVTVIIPDDATVICKEAIVMALIGTLRWREEENIFSSVTGASRDSIGGALWKTL